MKDFEQEKIRQFIHDEVMNNAVFTLIQNTFLRKKGNRDVNTLAAERLAIEFLDDAWKEMEKLKVGETSTSQHVDNVGL